MTNSYILVWYAILTRTAVFFIIHYNFGIIFIFLTCHLTLIITVYNAYFSLLLVKKNTFKLYDAPLYSHSMGTIYSSDRINLIKSKFELLQQFRANKSRWVHTRTNQTWRHRLWNIVDAIYWIKVTVVTQMTVMLVTPLRWWFFGDILDDQILFICSYSNAILLC